MSYHSVDDDIIQGFATFHNNYRCTNLWKEAELLLHLKHTIATTQLLSPGLQTSNRFYCTLATFRSHPCLIAPGKSLEPSNIHPWVNHEHFSSISILLRATWEGSSRGVSISQSKNFPHPWSIYRHELGSCQIERYGADLQDTVPLGCGEHPGLVDYHSIYSNIHAYIDICTMVVIENIIQLYQNSRDMLLWYW